jgi:hypothetical protein
MKHILTLMAGFCVAALAVPSHAQISDYENAILGQNIEARVGVTIPFGGDGKSIKSKPELALIGRRINSDRASIDWATKTDFVQSDYVETRLAVTLSAEPELRLNNRSFYQFETQQTDVSDGVKTAGKVALGAGLVVLAAAVVFVGVFAITYESDDS